MCVANVLPNIFIIIIIIFKLTYNIIIYKTRKKYHTIGKEFWTFTNTDYLKIH